MWQKFLNIINRYKAQKKTEDHPSWWADTQRVVNKVNLRKIELPFNPVRKEVIYIEKEYNETINQFLQEHLAEIKAIFAAKGYEFIYLPALYQQPLSEEEIQYYNPSGSPMLEPPILRSDFVQSYISYAANDLTFDMFVHSVAELGPALIRWIGDSDDLLAIKVADSDRLSEFSYLPVPEELSLEWFSKISQKYNSDCWLFHLESPKEYDADEQFPMEAIRLAEEIRKKIIAVR